MSYCLNPHCQNPGNDDRIKVCRSCQNSLLLGNRYLAMKLIGQGGFGRTFLAIDRNLPDRPHCVIKQFIPQAFNTRQAMTLFEQEAIRLSELGEHEQIPMLLNRLEQEGHQYLVQEFIDGENLAQELAQSGSFSESQIRQLLLDVLPVLQFVHEQQVIHRDIKPQNIIRRAIDRKLCLVDFGAAKLATGTALLKTGTLIGSAAYVAPEQLMGKAVFASDLYSLGVTCVHLLTQTDPFECYSIAQGTWVWRDYLQTSISQSLGSILDKLLRRGTSLRYPSAAAVLQDLNSVLAKAVTQPIASASRSATIAEISVHKSATVQHSSSKLSQHLTAKSDRSVIILLQKSVATILSLGAGGVLWNIPFAYQSEVDFKAHAVSTTGVIENTTAESRWVTTGISGGYIQTTYTSTILFKTLNGETKIFSVSSGNSIQGENKQVPVLYDSTRPSRARVGTEVYPMGVVYAGLFFGLLLLCGSVIMINKSNQISD